MGKVRDETTSAKTPKQSAKSGGGRKGSSVLGRYFGNLLSSDPYKPNQGWYARLWTALGLGALVVAGLFTAYNAWLVENPNAAIRLGVPVGLGAILGWIIYRTVHFAPFADFLIATEAEMNKVSWTSWPELKRATLVVLATLFLLAIYLFAVDLIWQFLLKLLGVLRFSSSGFGSQAG